MGVQKTAKSVASRLQKLLPRDENGRLFPIRPIGRFEFFLIRLLFAIAIYQTLPLGPPFSDTLHLAAPAVIDFAVEHNDSFRPLPPLTQMLPQSLPQMSFDGQPLPNGIAQFLDLSFYASPDFAEKLAWVCIPCLLFYVMGIGLPFCLPILALANIGACTFRNSQGAIHHGYQLLSLILLAQAVVAVFWLFRNRREALLGRPKRTDTPSDPPQGRTLAAHLVYYSALILAGCYVIAGAIKLINSDGEWPKNSHYIGIQFVKSDRQNWHNNLDSENYGKEKVPWANEMLEHPNISRALMSSGLLLELFAFLCLLGRIPALAMGAALISFHFFNEKVMGLVFYNNEKAIWIFLIIPGLFGLWSWFKKRQKTAISP